VTAVDVPDQTCIEADEGAGTASLLPTLSVIPLRWLFVWQGDRTSSYLLNFQEPGGEFATIVQKEIMHYQMNHGRYMKNIFVEAHRR
jgi:hypothetical protein